jgi:hypothetical protein
MRHLRLVFPALAIVMAGTWTTQVMACDKDKATKASAAVASKSTVCTAEMALSCNPEMAAACKAKGAKTTAYTASAVGARKAPGACATKATTTAMTAEVLSGAGSHCAGKGAATTSAVVAGASPKTLSESGGSCSGRGMASMAGKGHGNCDACADMAVCSDELEAAGARTQVVPLKNGVMFVYSAESPGKVNAVQSAMTRRGERLSQIVTAGDKAHLCPECKTIRGAMASGKMTREVVNIEGGALTLITSNDPALVAKIHAMVESHKGSRSKI